MVKFTVNFLVIVLAIGIVAAIAVPYYIKHAKRARTAEAVQHVESIHRVLAEWQANPNLGDGTLPSDITVMGKDGKTFLQHFPHETKRLSSGSKFYLYSFEQAVNEEGRLVPKVTVTARGGTGDSYVFGVILVSLPSGDAEVSKVSDSH